MSPPRGGRRGGGNGRVANSRARDNGQGRENGQGRGGGGGGRDSANRGVKKTNGLNDKRWKRPNNSSGSEDASSQPASQGSQGTPEVLYQQLKTRRVSERREAIKQGLMDDPDVRRKLKDAITFRGTCLGMCPEFEKVERVVQRAVDICEKDPPEASGRPVRERMVKEYRRSAAGNDAPLPSDVRPPLALQKTLDYLIDEILGGPLPLTKTNKFLWTRTRSIRQDFTFQNVGKSKNIHIAVDCFERICRMHILSLHQLSDPDIDSGDFSHQQEQEQFFKTLTSIMHFYEDCRFWGIKCKNEAEFCAIYILAYIQIPDIEKEAQGWPAETFNNPRVQTALEIHAAWQNVHDARGPLEKVSPAVTPDIVQNSFGRFWSLIRSSKVSYIMACVAEIHFNRIRRMALSAIVTSSKVRNVVDDWVLSDLMEFLGFDDEDQVQSFCEMFGMQIKEREDGDAFLVLDSGPVDPSPWPTQIFSESLVEFKRHNRTYPAIAYGYSVRQAREMGLIKRTQLNPAGPQFTPALLKGDSLFVSDGEDEPEQGLKPSDEAAASHPSLAPSIHSIGDLSDGSSDKKEKPLNPSPGLAFPMFGSQSSSFKPGTFGHSPFASTNNSFSFGRPSVASSGTPAFRTSFGTSETTSFGKPSIILNGNSSAVNARPSGVTSANPFQNGSLQTQPFPGIISKPIGPANPGAEIPIKIGGVFSTPSVLSNIRPSPPMISFGTASSTSKPQAQSIFSFGSASSAPSAPISTNQAPGAPNAFPSRPLFSFPSLPPTNPFSSPAPIEPDLRDIQEAPPPKAESNYGGFIVDEASPPMPCTIPTSIGGSPFGGFASSHQPPTPARPQTNPTPPHQEPLPSFNFTPAKTTPFQQQSGTPGQQKPEPIFGVHIPVSSSIPPISPPMPRPILEQKTADSSTNTLSHSISGTSSSKEPPYPGQNGFAPQGHTENAKPVGEVTNELSNWFLWGNGGIYDQFFQHIFPGIEESARQQIAEENSHQEADDFRRRKLMQRYFYRWKVIAHRNSLRRRGRRRRARGRTANNQQELIWTPVQYRASPNTTSEEALAQAIEAKNLVYQPVPLIEIFQGPVQQAFLEAKVPEGRWGLFAVNSDAKSDYWWQNKFGLYNGEDTSTGHVIKKASDLSAFTAFSRAIAPDLFSDVGCVVFGCSVDFSLGNEERFKKDRESLHQTMEHICRRSKYANVALLVICYRSPLDSTDLSFNDVDLGRCMSKGRLDRIRAATKALDIESLPPKVIGRNLVIVDSKNDLDLTPHIASLAELVLPTISPNLAKLRVPIASQPLESQSQGSRQRTNGPAINGTANNIAHGSTGGELGEHSVMSPGNLLMVKGKSTKRKGGASVDADPPPTKSRRIGEHYLSASPSKRYSLPNDLRGSDIFDEELLAKWKRLRQEVESPYSSPVETIVKQHQRSRTLGNTEGLSRLGGQELQISPRSSSSRGSSLLSGSWSQLHRGARDKTNTDYFRLKARGIEKLPNGNVAPAAVKPLQKKRPYDDSDSQQQPAQKKIWAKGTTMEDTSIAQNSKVGKPEEEDEELFAEARKVMNTITEGIEFYRGETRRAASRSVSREGA
ncbi:MAG: hypothetical protein M1840_006261 [Geoglossum simile]|nr:MAG: hypothetical protein M1840_006261 [Geoglossum simile]